MEAVKIEGADPKPIGAPPNWNPDDHGHCGALYVKREQADGHLFMTSAWAGTADEAGWMLAGANVQLSVSAVQHPVVKMGIGPTPLDSSPVYTIRLISSLAGEPGVRVTMYAPRTSEGGKTGGSVWAEAMLDAAGFVDAVKRCLESIALMAAEQNIV